MRRTLAVLSALGVLASAAAPALAASQGTERRGEDLPDPVERRLRRRRVLTTGGECGQVVADAWCESQGYAKSASYGIAAQDEYTGAIEAAPAVKTSDRPIRITCRD